MSANNNTPEKLFKELHHMVGNRMFNDKVFNFAFGVELGNMQNRIGGMIPKVEWMKRVSVLKYIQIVEQYAAKLSSGGLIGIYRNMTDDEMWDIVVKQSHETLSILEA